MTGENDTTAEATASQGDGSGYERSTIPFPYFDLAECIKIANAISSNVGRESLIGPNRCVGRGNG